MPTYFNQQWSQGKKQEPTGQQPVAVLTPEQEATKKAQEQWQGNIASGVDQARKTGFEQTAVAPVQKGIRNEYGQGFTSVNTFDDSMNMAQKEYVRQVGTDDMSGWESALYKYIQPSYDTSGKGRKNADPSGLFYAAGGDKSESDQVQQVVNRIQSFQPKVNQQTGKVEFGKKMTPEETLEIMKSIPASQQTANSSSAMKALEDKINAKKKFQDYSDFTSTKNYFAEMADGLDDKEKKYISDTYFEGQDFDTLINSRNATGNDMNNDLAAFGIDTWNASRSGESSISKAKKEASILKQAKTATDDRMKAISNLGGTKGAMEAIKDAVYEEETETSKKIATAAEMRFQSQQQAIKEDYEKRNIQNYIKNNPNLDDEALSKLMKDDGVNLSKINVTAQRNEMKRNGYRDHVDKMRNFDKALASMGVQTGQGGDMPQGQGVSMFKAAMQSSGDIQSAEKLLMQKYGSKTLVENAKRDYQKQVLGLSDSEIDNPDAFGTFTKKMEAGQINDSNAFSQALSLTGKDFKETKKMLSSAGYPEEMIEQMEENYQVNVMKVDPNIFKSKKMFEKMYERIDTAVKGNMSEDEKIALYDELSMYEAKNPKEAFRMKYKLENPNATAVEISMAESSAFKQGGIGQSAEKSQFFDRKKQEYIDSGMSEDEALRKASEDQRAIFDKPAKTKTPSTSSTPSTSVSNQIQTTDEDFDYNKYLSDNPRSSNYKQAEKTLTEDVKKELASGNLDPNNLEDFLLSEYNMSQAAINRIKSQTLQYDSSTQSYSSKISDNYEQESDYKNWPEYQDVGKISDKLDYKEKVEKGYISKPGRMSAMNALKSDELKEETKKEETKKSNIESDADDLLSEIDKFY